MPVKCTARERVLTVSLSGEVDHHAAKNIMQAIDSRIDRELPHSLSVDMSGVTFMDRSGIAVLLRAHRRMAALEGRMEVVGVPPQAQRVLRAAGLQRLMTFR